MNCFTAKAQHICNTVGESAQEETIMTIKSENIVPQTSDFNPQNNTPIQCSNRQIVLIAVVKKPFKIVFKMDKIFFPIGGGKCVLGMQRRLRAFIVIIKDFLFPRN